MGTRPICVNGDDDTLQRVFWRVTECPRAIFNILIGISGIDYNDRTSKQGKTLGTVELGRRWRRLVTIK